MKNIINKIKNMSLEQINKSLLFIALLSLFFRVGNFAIGYTPKPFEVIFVLLCILTLIDLIKNKKIKEFFFSIPRNIRIALFCLIFSILFGWVFANFFLKISLYFNMILEFGTFVISLGTFILILFYTRNDKNYIKKYFYALLIPIIYVTFIIFPELAYNLKIALGNHFVGFTTNPNIISKILIIPTIFFIVKTLFENNNKFYKLGYFTISSFLVSLLFWTCSRGAVLSLILGMIFIWLMFSLNNFNWKKLFKSGVIIFLICLVGFILAPKGVRESVITRISNTNIIQSTNSVSSNNLNKDSGKEPRLRIWSFYLNKTLMNPFGYGPNTHMPSYVMLENGLYDNSGPHNTFLQIWLWGGLLGLLSFVYLLIIVYKNLIIKLKINFNPITVALATILFALSISIMFDDSLSFYWFWVILALSLRI